MPQHSLPTRIAGVAGRPEDQHRLLEARVEPGQEREVRAVLAVGVDDEPVVAARRRPARGARSTRSAYSAAGSSGRSTRARRSRGGRPSRAGPSVIGRRAHGAGGVHGAAAAARRGRCPRTGSAASVIHGPTSPSGQVTRTSALVGVAEAEVRPAELAAGVAAADHELAPGDRGSPIRVSIDGADRVAVRAGLAAAGRRASRPSPPAHRPMPRADVAPQPGGRREVDHDEVEQPVDVEVGERRAAAPVER